MSNHDKTRLRPGSSILQGMLYGSCEGLDYFGIDEIGQGSLLVLTPRIFDEVDNFALFSTRRAEAKKLFRPGLFRITNEPRFRASP
ncbi:hypothetical protein, partial [Cupriavidus basilensis]|uniref:hypothetical protein n=1 Tax=Cupriavidus basilensis TaxID=68895 RepID=UPI001ED958C1